MVCKRVAKQKQIWLFIAVHFAFQFSHKDNWRSTSSLLDFFRLTSGWFDTFIQIPSLISETKIIIILWSFVLEMSDAFSELYLNETNVQFCQTWIDLIVSKYHFPSDFSSLFSHTLSLKIPNILRHPCFCNLLPHNLRIFFLFLYAIRKRFATLR